MRIRLNPKPVAQCGLLLVAGPVFLALGWQEVRDDVRLQRTGVVTHADVYDWRILDHRGVTHYELRYKFSAPGHPGQFSRSDPALGREDLWSSVAPEVWTGSQQLPRIDVRFVPDDPRINSPVAVAGNPWGDKLAGLIVGVLALATAGVMLSVAAVQYTRCCRQPPGYRREFFLFTAEPGADGEAWLAEPDAPPDPAGG